MKCALLLLLLEDCLLNLLLFVLSSWSSWSSSWKMLSEGGVPGKVVPEAFIKTKVCDITWRF